MSTKTITIAKDFSQFVGGRYKRLGPYSGEEFRDDYLIPALNEYEKVIIEMDGAYGYGSSFLEEAFGGLVRKTGKSISELEQRLVLNSKRESYIEEAWQYMKDAENQINKN